LGYNAETEDSDSETEVEARMWVSVERRLIVEDIRKIISAKKMVKQSRRNVCHIIMLVLKI
jgi:hypothetical protein